MGRFYYGRMKKFYSNCFCFLCEIRSKVVSKEQRVSRVNGDLKEEEIEMLF